MEVHSGHRRMSASSSRSALAVAVLVLAGWIVGAGPASGHDARPTVIVVADPQIHNVYGGGVRQTWVVSDVGTGVAQRPPELNLMAPYMLTRLVQRLNALEDTPQDAPIIVLGDTTNVACSSELDRFEASIAAARRPGQLVFMAHGNHDSYLMGTVNSYVPKPPEDDIEAYAAHASPPDASWWLPPRHERGRSWNRICQSPDGGLPLNKGQWLARYVASLAPAGLSLETEAPVEGDDAGAVIRGRVAPGSALAEVNYRAIGRWVPPRRNDEGKWERMRVSRSYLVQAFDLGATHRMILFDSSVCKEAKGGAVAFFRTNAGTHACVGDEQINDIAALAAEADGRTLVFGAHFPFRKFEPDERKRLLAVMGDAAGGWTYLSAHTHHPHEPQWRGRGVELNVGSTTDWPMEGVRVEFTRDETRFRHTRIRLAQEPLRDYRRAWSSQGSELCRHVEAAEALADMEIGEAGAWQSPGTAWRLATCLTSGRAAFVDRMSKAEATIARRMREEPGYEEAAFEVAAAASLHEYEEITGADVLEAFGWD